MTPQDAVKLLYQSEFGAAHLFSEPERVFNELLREGAPMRDRAMEPDVEPIGDGFCRLGLAGTSYNGIAPETVFRLFRRATDPAYASPARFADKRAQLMNCAVAQEMPFSASDARAYLKEYEAAGCPAVRHSEQYRAAYAPAYRLVRAADAALLPLLSAIGRRAPKPVIVAIDGACGSGKSTFAARLAELIDCNLFHMDDFFLPMAQKTPERLAQPGGNCDAERFAAEVLAPLKTGEPFSYRPFHCHTQALGDPIAVTPKRVTIVEGSYALHPLLDSAYDLRVFLTVPSDLQRVRIIRRDGEAMWKRFESEWIPLEQRYFQSFRISERCSFTFAPIDWMDTRQK